MGYRLDYVLDLTVPQIKILESNLSRICKMEAGKEDEDVEKVTANTLALTGTIEMLKKETGRDNFSMSEIMNPSETIRKYRGI